MIIEASRRSRDPRPDTVFDSAETESIDVYDDRYECWAQTAFHPTTGREATTFTTPASERATMEWNPILAFWAAIIGLVYLLFALYELRTDVPTPAIE